MMNDIDFGTQCKVLRVARKLTLVALAKELSYSQALLSNIETGKKNPTAKMVADYCRYFDLNLIESYNLYFLAFKSTNVIHFSIDEQENFLTHTQTAQFCSFLLLISRTDNRFKDPRAKLTLLLEQIQSILLKN